MYQWQYEQICCQQNLEYGTSRESLIRWMHMQFCVYKGSQYYCMHIHSKKDFKVAGLKKNKGMDHYLKDIMSNCFQRREKVRGDVFIFSFVIECLTHLGYHYKLWNSWEICLAVWFVSITLHNLPPTYPWIQVRKSGYAKKVLDSWKKDSYELERCACYCDVVIDVICAYATYPIHFFTSPWSSRKLPTSKKEQVLCTTPPAHTRALLISSSLHLSHWPSASFSSLCFIVITTTVCHHHNNLSTIAILQKHSNTPFCMRSMNMINLFYTNLLSMPHSYIHT